MFACVRRATIWNDRAKSNWAILPVSTIVTADAMGVENCGMRRARERERERVTKTKKKNRTLKRVNEKCKCIREEKYKNQNNDR